MSDLWSSIGDGIRTFFTGIPVGPRNAPAPAGGFTNPQAMQNWLTVASKQDLVDAGYVDATATDAQVQQKVHDLMNMPAPRPDSEKLPSYGTGNPAIDGIINAVGGAGVGYGTDSGVHIGAANPGSTPGNLNTDQVANDAADSFQATQHTIIPQNPSSTMVGSSSYNPLTPQSINKVGYHNVFGDIDQGPSVGLTPINNGGPNQVNADGTYAGQPTNATSGFVQTGGGPTQAVDAASTTPDATALPSTDPNLGDIAKGVAGAAGAVAPFLPLIDAAGNAILTGKAAEDAKQAAIGAGDVSAAGYNQAQAVSEQQYKQQQTYQNPYIQAALGPNEDGTGGALAKLTTFDQDHQFNYNQNSDPSYQFRLSEGLKALQNGAGAAGTLFGGNTIKAANNYAQDSASQEYQNAFNRFNTTTQNQRSGLQDLAHMGQTASDQATQASQNYASTSGNDFIGAANAKANAQIGAANVNSSAYSNIGTNLSNGVSAYLNNQNQMAYINALNKNKTGA